MGDSGLTALFLMFAAFSQGGKFNFPMPAQRLTVKCKTTEGRNEIVAAFYIFKANLLRAELNANSTLPCENKSFSVERVPTEQDRQAFERAFDCYKGDEDNSLNIFVLDENRAFNLLSFIEPFLDGIVSVSMMGVNKFIK